MASISSAASRSGKGTSEYQVVRGHFGPLVKQCQHVLLNLANELFKKDLIGKMEYNAIIKMFQSTYGTAVNMMNSVLTKIEYNSSSFRLLVKCLRVAGLNYIADDLETALSEEFTFDGGSRLVPKAYLSSPVSGSRGENTSEYKIVRDHFGPLVKQCQHVLASFANELFNRELITKVEWQDAIDNLQPIYNRIVIMLHSVLTKIENNSSCFHLLVTCLKIAELHSIADDLETALRVEKNFGVAIRNPKFASWDLAADLKTTRGKLAAWEKLASWEDLPARREKNLLAELAQREKLGVLAAHKRELAAERKLATHKRKLAAEWEVVAHKREQAAHKKELAAERELAAHERELAAHKKEVAAERELAAHERKLAANERKLAAHKKELAAERELATHERELATHERELAANRELASVRGRKLPAKREIITALTEKHVLREQEAAIREQEAAVRNQKAALEGNLTALGEDLGHSLSVSSSSQLPLNVVTTTKAEVAYETWRSSGSHKSG